MTTANDRKPVQTFETCNEAFKTIPHGSSCQAAYGLEHDGGFSEIWKAPDGKLYEISNGPVTATAPFVWTVTITNG